MRKVFAGLLLPALITAVSMQTDAANVAVVVTLDPNQGQLPESITADDDGNVFLSMTAAVWKVIPDGHHTPAILASLPVAAGASSVGLKVGFDGFIYALTAAFDPTLDASHLWRVSPNGTSVQEIAHFSATGFPNDLAFDDDGNIFVTDAALGVLYKIDPHHNASVFLDDPLLKGNPAAPVFGSPFGANGIAFDKNKRDLFVANSDFGRILRVHLGDDDYDPPGPVEVFASDPRLTSLDGIAFDKKGQLYAAVNLQNQIALVDQSGHVSIVASGGPLHGPSSFVFGTHGNSKKTLFISSFSIAQAVGLQPGTPQPSLDSIEVQFGGLPLP